MLQNDRILQTLEIIKKHRSVRYSKLAAEMHTSLSTARRDADTLVQQGYAEKVYGGIVLAGQNINTMPIAVRESTHREEKEALARQAVQVLSNNKSVFLYASSTVSLMVPLLSRCSGLKVLTNSTELCITLEQNGVEAYCTGGRLRMSDHVFMGSFAEEALEHFRPDYAFFSPTAVSADGEITIWRENSASFLRKMIKRSRNVYMLCDASKLNQSCFFSIGGIEDVNGIFCNAPLPAEWAERIGSRRER